MATAAGLGSNPYIPECDEVGWLLENKSLNTCLHILLLMGCSSHHVTLTLHYRKQQPVDILPLYNLKPWIGSLLCFENVDKLIDQMLSGDTQLF